MSRTPLFSIGTRTLIHGAFMAAGGAIAGTVQQWIESGCFPTTFHEYLPALKVAGGAALVYIGKEFMSNSSGQILKKEK
jgi:hypothetical protein